jgi:hypothetical protein
MFTVGFSASLQIGVRCVEDHDTHLLYQLARGAMPPVSFESSWSKSLVVEFVNDRRDLLDWVGD